MNKQITQLPSNWLKIVAAMSLLIIIGGFTKVSAQCRFVTISNSGEKLVVDLPSSFPIYHNLNNSQLEDEQFEKSLKLFKEKYPSLSYVIFKPSQVAPGTYIEVPESYLSALSQEDRDAIIYASFFYVIIK